MSVYVNVGHNNSYMCCGVLMMWGFKGSNHYGDLIEVGPGMFNTFVTREHNGGFNRNKAAGLVQAGFTSDGPSKNASDSVFEEMNKHFFLVFKSEPRENKNSGATFYTAIWDFTKDANGKDIE